MQISNDDYQEDLRHSAKLLRGEGFTNMADRNEELADCLDNLAKAEELIEELRLELMDRDSRNY